MQSLRLAPWLLAAVALAAAPVAAKAPPAEFAVRWDPREGGPTSAEQALRLLSAKRAQTTTYEVRYYDLHLPEALPPGFGAITRKRVGAGVAEVTFKMRGQEPLPGEPSLKRWRCPLGKSSERKDEVDIGFVGAGQVVRAWSRSCGVESRDLAIEPDAALTPRPRGCASTMTRLRAGDLKVEAWRMADGSGLIEASRAGRDDARHLGAFEHDVLAPLLAAGIRPLSRSKSAIGGDCAR